MDIRKVGGHLEEESWVVAPPFGGNERCSPSPSAVFVLRPTAHPSKWEPGPAGSDVMPQDLQYR